LVGLKELALTVDFVDFTGAAALAAALPRLRLGHLDLSRCRQIGDDGAMALAASPGLASVAVLRLSECGIGPAGARALAESPYLKGLRYLELSGNRVGEEGALDLASSPHLRNLSLLGLASPPLSAAAVEALAGSPCLPNLALLLVTGGAGDYRSLIGDAAWGALKRRFGEKLISCSEAMWDRAAKIIPREPVMTLDYLPDLLF
jgi:hypothetical protein